MYTYLYKKEKIDNAILLSQIIELYNFTARISSMIIRI